MKEFANLDCSKGTHHVEFNASSLNSGIYYYMLKAGNNTVSRKMVLLNK